MGEFVREISASEPSPLLASSKPVVVDFYSTECPPCEALAPKFDAVAVTHQVSNFPGFPKPMPGYLLADHMVQQAEEAGVIPRLAAEVTSGYEPGARPFSFNTGGVARAR